MMSSKTTSKKSGEFRYATRLLALERGRRQSQPKEMAPLKACRHLLKSDDWESSKFSLMPRNTAKKPTDRRGSAVKEVKTKYPKNREKVVIVSKKSSSVRVVKSGSQKCLRGVQRSVSVKKVSYSTSVILSSEEDESDSEDDDEDDDDDDYEDKSRISTRKRDTVIKHTMSKIRTNYCKSKKIDSRSSKKARALKLLREKSSGKKKGSTSLRELRPRFPYSPTQEWPTARAHRMASLNALAKVHVLYENEGRTQGEAEDNSLLDLISDDHSSNDTKPSPKETRSATSFREKEKDKEKGNKNDGDKRRKSTDTKPKVVKRRRKRKLPCDVEIIDTKICKRMASLNAQAILAASYLQEKPKRRERNKIEGKSTPSSTIPDPELDIKEIFVESACNLQIVDSLKDQSPLNKESVDTKEIIPNPIENIECVPSQENSKETENVSSSDTQMFQAKYDNKDQVAEIPTVDNELCIPAGGGADSTLSSESVSEVGVTKYTKVTKVQINTTKEMEIKEEGKAERKIGRIVEKDDVAITRMYHYQSNTASQSYCVRMETTYKPTSRNFPPMAGPQRSGVIPHPHVMGAVMPTRQSYYNYQNRPGILASQSYPLNRSMQPVVGIEQHVARQYGSNAFTMPHYGHSPPMSYPHNEYGFFQPAGPMIQPVHEQYMIHKPVPCHPQPHQPVHHAQPPRTATATATSNRERYSASNSCFSRQNEAPPIKPKHSSSSAKHSDLLRSEVSSPNSASSSQFLSRPTSENMRPSTSHSHMSGLHVRPMPQKHYREQEKQDNFKYHIGSPSYPQIQEHHSYPAPGYQECSPNMIGAQQSPIPHHSKAHPVLMHHDNCNDVPNQYLPPPPPATTSVPSKIELSQLHGTTFVESDKYNVPKFEPAPYKSDTVGSRKDENSCIDKSPSLWRPPLVVDLDNEEPKNTKTYIELDVPKACPRDKIVVVDVDKEEKEQVRKRGTHSSSQPLRSCPNTRQPDIIELPTPKRETGTVMTRERRREFNESQSKDLPDVMFIEVMKKKEPSALIRRAKLHGKQRTYRDSENRPLVPYANMKKAGSGNIPLHYQKNAYQPHVTIPHLNLPRNMDSRMTHGWSWEGKPSEKLVYVTNDDPPFLRSCYPAMRHHEGDVIKVRDCVLLKSGARKTDLPFIAKIAALWENPVDGEMTMSLFWYYRPEHTDPGRKPYHTDGEIFASKHCDTNSVACIEDKCYVLTFGEFCRYRRHCKMLESTCESPVSVVPPIDDYPRKGRLPPSCISPEMVFFCRKVYDFRQKRILKNPA